MPYHNMPKALWPKMEKCVADVKKKGSSVNAYAVCYESIMGKGKHKAAKETSDGDFVLDMELVELLGYKQNKVKCPECDAIVMPDKDGMCPECGADLSKDTDLEQAGKGIKAFEDSAGGKHIVLWTSNAFEDREREIFSTKAWQDYVDRRDSNGRKDRVWFWHVKGTDFATVEWQDVVGRFLLEVAKVDDTEYGNKMFHAIQHPEEFPDLLPQGWGTSHGYVYKLGDKQGGVYNWVEKFESTILPFHRASNMFGGIKEVLDMSMKKEKRDGLAGLVGEELAEELTSEAEKATKTLEKKGVAHKGDKEDEAEAEVETEEAEAEVETEVEEGDAELYEMELDATTLKEIADKVDVKSVVDKAVKEAITTLKSELVEAVKVAAKEIAEKEVGDHKEKVVKDVMSGKVRLKPYVATKSKDNVIRVKEADGDDINLDDEDTDEKDSKGSPMDALPGAKVVKAAVQGMLSGTLG